MSEIVATLLAVAVAAAFLTGLIWLLIDVVPRIVYALFDDSPAPATKEGAEG